MIEVIYKEEKQEAKNGENLFNLPRNIRQVGLTTGNMRIYIEDYVYTFLTRLCSCFYRRNKMEQWYNLSFHPGSVDGGRYGSCIRSY